MRHNGFSNSTDPILDPLDTIECRDAILTPDGCEPEWPDADVVIGNPPFLGGKLLIGELDADYVEALRGCYKEELPAFADLVCYWFHKAGKLVANGGVARSGLVATNSIRGGKNRAVLDRIVSESVIYDAWSDEPWVVSGAAVRVSLVCFSGTGDVYRPETRVDGKSADKIHSDLTAKRGETGSDLTKAARLPENFGVAFEGNQKGGAFDIPGDLAREWLCAPSNPNGRPNSDVLKPWVNGVALARRPSDIWLVDFGDSMSEIDAALYEIPFAYVATHVKPVRQKNRLRTRREFWFRHACPRPKMRKALDGMARYIVTPRVAKHRLFIWLDSRVCPDSQLTVIARDDDTAFGILHSRFHESWSLRLGTSLEDRPRYTPTTTFRTFPFPLGISPDIPAADYADNAHAIEIAEAARQLVKLRDHWLNPPELVEWVDEPVPGYPKRPVPRDSAAGKQLKARTLTKLYNARPQWLDDAHAALDAAVAAAYGWDAEVSEEEALARLLEMNRTAR